MMKTAYRFAAVLLVSSSFLQGQTQPASSSTSSEQETIKLPSFTVTSEKADPYRSNDALSISRVASNIIDSPLTVNVVPKELMADLGATVSYDVTRYFAGVSGGRGAGAGGIMDRQNFRGFESFSKTIDNFSSFLQPTGSGFQANFDPAFVERSELVMGPDTILSPTGSPGGSINIITKSPLFKASNDLSVQVGNYSAQKVVLDSTGPINHKLAYRVIASYQNTKTYVPGHVKQFNGSVQFAYKFSDTSKLTFKWFGEDWGVTGAQANPNNNGTIVYMPDTILGRTISSDNQLGFRHDGWNGSNRWSQRWDRLNIASLEYTGTIADRVSVRLAAQQIYDNFDQDVGYPAASPSETFNTAGQVIGLGAFNPAAVPELGQMVHQTNYDEQLQNDYAANFHPGAVSLQPVVGWAYQQGSQPTNTNRQDKNAADFPAANLFASDVYAPARVPFSKYTTSYSEQIEHAWLIQSYGVLKAGFFDDKVLVTGGASRTWAKPVVYTDTTVGTTIKSLGPNNTIQPAAVTASAPAGKILVNNFGYTGQPLAPTQKGYKDTYLGGILLKPMKDVALYYSFSTNSGIPGNLPVIWQTGKQHEFGLKTQFFDQRLSFTVSHFQITQSNVATVNPAHNIDATQPATLLSNLSNHGFEFNLVGGLTKNVSIVASFTKMKLRDAVGRRRRNIPDQLANLLLNYHFTEGALKNLSVFAGLVHVGNTAGEDPGNGLGTAGAAVGQPGFYVAAWNVINAGASYTWDRYRFNLNVDNVADSKFWWQPAGRISVSAYPGITFRFSTSVHF